MSPLRQAVLVEPLEKCRNVVEMVVLGSPFLLCRCLIRWVPQAKGVTPPRNASSYQLSETSASPHS